MTTRVIVVNDEEPHPDYERIVVVKIEDTDVIGNRLA